MLDLSAAFETIDQDILLNDLMAFGIVGIVLEWFRTYLKNRKFRVCFNDTLSDECLMKTGFPQGSILDPILFLIYTVELHYVLESLGVFYHCYEVDTQIYFTFEDLTEAENKLGVIFNKVDQWMRSRRLKLSPHKTEFILAIANNIMRRIFDISSVMLGNIPVKLSNSERNLKFVFDNQLNLNE